MFWIINFTESITCKYDELLINMQCYKCNDPSFKPYAGASLSNCSSNCFLSNINSNNTLVCYKCSTGFYSDINGIC